MNDHDCKNGPEHGCDCNGLPRYLFEEYLQEVHGKQYSGTDDLMPEDFQEWLSNMDIGDLIEYGNKAMAKLIKK